MRVFAWAALFGLIGLVGGYAVTLGIGVVLMDFYQVSQREGAAAMALAFVFAPMGAVATAIVAASAAALVTARRQRGRAGTSIAPRAGWSRRARGIAGGIAGLVIGYGIAVLILAIFYQLRGSPYFSSYSWALAAGWSPFVLAALGAAGGALLGTRGVAEAGH